MRAKAFSHDRVMTGKEEWLTPPEIIRALGEFDLDPCSPIARPWDTAKHHYTIRDDGLLQDWFGRVWLNPPYGNKTEIWLRRMAEHGRGTALIFSRTETRMFHESIFKGAAAILFLAGRLTFYNADGTRPSYSAGAPSCLIAYGDKDAGILSSCGLRGDCITAWSIT